MLRIYDVMRDVLKNVKPVIDQIEKHDADLAKQMKRASTSVLLNIAEGSGSTGGVRKMRYRTALGSARETRACIDAAEALGYVKVVAPEARAGLLHVVNVLVHITA